MKKITRREMLKLVGYGAAGLALTSCCPTPDPTEMVDPTDQPTAKPGETAVPTDVPEPTVEPTPAPPVVVNWVEGPWGDGRIGPQAEVDKVFAEMSSRMQDEGLNIEVHSIALDDWRNEFPLKFIEPDMTCAFQAGWGHMNSLRDQGGLAPLEDLLVEYGPHATKAYTERVIEVNHYSDGHLYGLPAIFNVGSTRGILYRLDLAEKYGLDPIPNDEGYEGMLPFLRAIKENEPDLLPLAQAARSGFWDGAGGAEDARLWRQPKMGFGIPDMAADLDLVNAEEMEQHKVRFGFVRSLVEEDLVNSNPIQAFEDEGAGYLASGQCAAIKWHSPEGALNSVREAVTAAIPDAKVEAVDLAGYRSGDAVQCAKIGSHNRAVFNAAASEEAVVAGIQWFDWILSDQANIDLYLLGIEGVHHNLEPDMRYSKIEGVDESNRYLRRWYMGGIPGRFERYDVEMSQELLEYELWRSNVDNFMECPFYNEYKESAEIQENYSPEMAALKDEVDIHINALTFGQKADIEAALNEMGEALDAIGRQTVKDAYQADIDAWAA